MISICTSDSLRSVSVICLGASNKSFEPTEKTDSHLQLPFDPEGNDPKDEVGPRRLAGQCSWTVQTFARNSVFGHLCHGQILTGEILFSSYVLYLLTLLNRSKQSVKTRSSWLELLQSSSPPNSKRFTLRTLQTSFQFVTSSTASEIS